MHVRNDEVVLTSFMRAPKEVPLGGAPKEVPLGDKPESRGVVAALPGFRIALLASGMTMWGCRHSGASRNPGGVGHSTAWIPDRTVCVRNDDEVVTSFRRKPESRGVVTTPPGLRIVHCTSGMTRWCCRHSITTPVAVGLGHDRHIRGFLDIHFGQRDDLVRGESRCDFQ